MFLLLFLPAILLGIVEGLTEFLPVSSTGHLILASSLLHAAAKFHFDTEKMDLFEIVIQTGAIFAVILVYWHKIRETAVNLPHSPKARRFALNVLVGFLPAVVLGLVLGKVIKAHLFTPLVVASTFILGAFVILWAERRQQGHAARVQTVDEMTPLDALIIGFAQCFALVPGTSRSGATIIGGMFRGLSRPAATEFSFFLSIPTLIGAGLYSLYKDRASLSVSDFPLFAIGLLFSFLSAWVCVRWLLRYVSTHNFKPFAWYRIAFGLVVLLTAWTGWVTWAE
jgi:undecaprenyl-diphosphatase